MNAKKQENDMYDIPLNVSDIINVCKEFTKLGFNIQNQIEYINEYGVDEAIKNKCVKLESLPYIKNFLEKICENVYFGDATSQAQETIFHIKTHLEKLKVLHIN